MKFYLLAFILLLSNIYAKETLAIVNGNKITTDVASNDFNTMSIEQKKITINRLIEKELAIEYALSSDIVESEKFKKTYEHIVNKTNANKSLSQKLRDENKLDEQTRSRKGLLAFDMLLDKKAEELKPSEKELKDFFDINRYLYNSDKKYELLNIVVDDEKTATMIKKELDKSENKLESFKDLAVKYSKAPNSEKNGYLGQFEYNVMQPDIQKAVKNLNRGEYSQVFPTTFGYEIVYVMGTEKAIKRDFKEAYADVKKDFVEKQVIKWAFSKIDEMKKSADIKILFDNKN